MKNIDIVKREDVHTFNAKFKCGATESVLYFRNWTKTVQIYDTERKNGETFFLIKPEFNLFGDYIWLNSQLFN